MNNEKILEDEKFMRRAIELAKLGKGWTNPNPLVGAVIVRGGKIIGEGFHKKYGTLHAERDAIADMKSRGENGKDAVIYVTLEPCCHFGKQPPCTYAIVEEGIKKVVVGSRDPNPLVHGKGNAYLREHGVEVVEDFLKDECDSLNDIFFKFITTERPFIALKYAMTVDGKIATKSGQSKWITGNEARGFVHQLRNRYNGIVCGIGTVLADNPLLNCRLNDFNLLNCKTAESSDKNEKMPLSSVERFGINNPVRIVCDKNLRIPLDCNIIKTAGEIKTIIAAGKNVLKDKTLFEKKSSIEKAGAEVLLLDDGKSGSGIDLSELVSELGKRKIDSLLVEGGGELNFGFLEEGLVDKIYAFVAPKIFGSDKAFGPVRGKGIDEIGDAFNFKIEKTEIFGKDLLIEMGKE